MKLEKDTNISHYKILSKIGKGGMGEVYLAEDTKLDRQVALKILPAEFAEDSERMNRFVREAKSASALNHPNIITIYEINEIDNTQFIATEFIDGKTLNEYAKDNPLNYKSALDIANQVASALDVAHLSGIVHRDIKPDNVMIRPDGFVKILDFGIAKLSEKETLEIDSEDATAVQQPSTTPGMIIGTANYMSPEQAKGEVVDARTDIFSFGVVLYEMLAGHLPFEGKTPMEIIGAVIHKEPKQMDEEVPSEIQRIISKTLRKDRDERYQTIKDLLIDLKDVKRELEFQDKLEKTVSPEKESQKTQMLKATTVEEQKTTNISEGRRNRLPIIAGAGVLAALLIFAGWYFLPGGLFSDPKPFAKIKTEKITTSSSIIKPILSPDNKLIAYIKIDNKDINVQKWSLIVRQIGSGVEKVIYEVTNMVLDPHTFSSDGEYIYFSIEKFGVTSDLFRISTFGDNPKKILENVSQNLFISPDGKKMAYKSRRKPNERPNSVYVANIDGSDPEKIYDAEDFDSVGTDLGGWSQDGTKLLIGLRQKEDSGKSDAVGFQVLIGTFDLTLKELAAKERFNEIHKGVGERINSLQWLPGGDGIIFAGGIKGTARNQLWHISYPEGKLRKITDDANSYEHVMVSPDGKTIASITELSLVSLWSIDPADQKVRQVKAATPRMKLDSLSAMPDGRLIFLKESDSGTTVYSMNEDGTDEKEIFSLEEDIYELEVSPDGKYFVAAISSKKTVASNLYRFNADGSNRKKLTNFDDSGSNRIQITADGWILFERRLLTSRSEDPTDIMKVSLEGEKAEKISGLEPTQRDRKPRLSPDGKYLAYETSLTDETSGKIKEYIRVTQFSDGKAGKKIIEKQVDVSGIRWQSDSSAIIYEKTTNLKNLFKLDLNNQMETQVSDFSQKADTGNFVWKQDGKNILTFRESEIANLVLIRDMAGVKDQ